MASVTAWIDSERPLLILEDLSSATWPRDIGSDNICVSEGTAVLLDWNIAHVGNSDSDLAFWLPSLASEGGPRPDDVMPGCPPAIAAYVAGFIASPGRRAAHPPRPWRTPGPAGATAHRPPLACPRAVTPAPRVRA